MELHNGTRVQEFILLGFDLGPQKRLLLLIFFSILYVITLAENVTIITVVVLDTHLSRLPMYILLGSFSWLEICYETATVPRMLVDLASLHGIISFQACFFQFYIFFSLCTTECFFLSAMALDRYFAICHPLRYTQIMSPKFCCVLVSACWLLGFLLYVIPVILISNMNFCGPNVMDHFLCDPGPILAVACPPLPIAPIILLNVMDAIVCLGNMSVVVLSYGSVILTLMKTSRRGNRMKSFSTISFHLVVVALFYGPVAGSYVVPPSASEKEVIKVITVFYTAVTPFLNPMIYCLRNNQMKEALGRLWKKKTIFLKSRVTGTEKKIGKEHPTSQQH